MLSYYFLPVWSLLHEAHPFHDNLLRWSSPSARWGGSGADRWGGSYERKRQLRVLGLWLHAHFPKLTLSDYLSLRGTVILAIGAGRSSKRCGTWCKGGQKWNMAEYFFPGPTKGFSEAEGRDGRSVFHREVGKKYIFSEWIYTYVWLSLFCIAEIGTTL